MISISLNVNGHTANVTAENADQLDVVLAKVVAAMQKLPVQYQQFSPTRDWGGLRPMNPLDRYGAPPTYPPGTILCDAYATPASQLR